MTITKKTNEIEKRISNYDHDKYITSQEFNKSTAENFSPKLAQANLASKNDIANFDELKTLNKKLLQIKQNMYLLKIY